MASPQWNEVNFWNCSWPMPLPGPKMAMGTYHLPNGRQTPWHLIQVLSHLALNTFWTYLTLFNLYILFSIPNWLVFKNNLHFPISKPLLILYSPSNAFPFYPYQNLSHHSKFKFTASTKQYQIFHLEAFPLLSGVSYGPYYSLPNNKTHKYKCLFLLLHCK
jgi:hypothetical protein